jgi:hypothetical protein
MEKILEEIDFLIGNEFDVNETLLKEHSFDVFSEDAINFLSNISEFLLKSPKIREYPDVATFAFYCRRANLNSIKKKYCKEINPRIGRGVVFHITPGNVPVNFAYSLFAGLITGNINIIRVPSKDFVQVKLIVEAIKSIISIDKYKSIFANRLYLLRYNRQSTATDFLSSLCDVRIIWGGDNTINEIRKSPIPPKSTEVTFSDRYSVAVIRAKKYLEYQNKEKIALDFYNDTYLFDQNACTSPQTIYWIGSNIDIEAAQSIFWDKLHNKLNDKKFTMQPIVSIDKLTTFYSQAIFYGDISMDTILTNEVFRVKNNSVHKNIDLFRCSSGYFNEVQISSLDELTPIVKRGFQTIGYFGFCKQEFEDWFRFNRPLGVDRIVPIGKTMDFSMTWDGFDLVSVLSRGLTVL